MNSSNSTPLWDARFSFWRTCSETVAKAEFELIIARSGPWPWPEGSTP